MLLTVTTYRVSVLCVQWKGLVTAYLRCPAFS